MAKDDKGVSIGYYPISFSQYLFPVQLPVQVE